MTTPKEPAPPAHTNGKHLCIHGHFYQPPRENAWFEEVELQESAAPFHDWNQRIFHECYRPNAIARVIGPKGKIMDIVNNYERMSFNFGPTLLTWMENRHAKTYQHILDADRKSAERLNGHGNAIAQAYNHMIMPLANRRDKITQTRWGIEDFKHRFGRTPESIWLPETACNEDTLEVLMDHGIKYVILEPHQAEKIRLIDNGEWIDVTDGSIDPRRPYRYFDSDNRERHIDLFFYDGPVSRGVGFEDIVSDAQNFMSRIEAATGTQEEPQIVNIATDGETYGHHKAFGDRALAYMLNIEAENRGYALTNYGAFLETYPPFYEVRIKSGENGEGTSWSCAHGVQRWKEHCGCRGDGPAEWHQHWRKPLRDALDWLRDELARVFAEEGSRLFVDEWEARNGYIEVIVDRSPENMDRFFKKYAARELDPGDRIRAIKLLEMQRHAMLMYTSCGWFFTELSGIETVQILQYAARGVQLASEVTGVSLEEEFMTRLEQAPSNVSFFGNGRGIYEKLVRPKVVTAQHVAAYYSICSAFENYYDETEKFHLYGFDLEVKYQRNEAFGNLNLNFGRLRLTSRITREEADLIFITAQVGLYDFRSSIKVYENTAQFEAIEKDIFEGFQQRHIVELLRKVDDHFGQSYFALKDLPVEDRVRIIRLLTREIREKISAVYENLYEENRRIYEIYDSLNLPIPDEIRYAAEYALTRRLSNALIKAADSGFDTKRSNAVSQILKAAVAFGIKLPSNDSELFLTEQLRTRTDHFSEEIDVRVIRECLLIHRLARNMGIHMHLRAPQDQIFYLLKRWEANPSAMPESIQKHPEDWIRLMEDLHIHSGRFKKIVKQTLSTISSEAQQTGDQPS